VSCGHVTFFLLPRSGHEGPHYNETAAGELYGAAADLAPDWP